MVDQGEAGKDLSLINVEDEDALVAGVLRDLEEEIGEKGSYYNLDPEKYRNHVDSLVEANYPSYRDQYPERREFREAMSKDWLAKFRAFGKLAEDEGLRQYDRKKDGSEKKLNECALAILTRSASYILMGTGAYDKKGPGASGVYSKIPLRQEGATNKRLDKGVYALNIPEVDKRFDAPLLLRQSSPLVSIFLREVASATPEDTENSLRRLDDISQVVFKRIDDSTVKGK